MSGSGTSKLRDLCVTDKRRVAGWLQLIARLAKEKQELVLQLENERQNNMTVMEKVREYHQIIMTKSARK